MVRTIIISVVFFVLFSAIENSFAYDTTLAKYIPLRVGNMWVYYGVDGQQAPPYHSEWLIKYRITGAFDTLGKKFYVIQDSVIQIIGSISGPLLPRLISIDSATMNIHGFGVFCNQGDYLIDSLRSQKNDTANICDYPPYNKDVLTDTSNINLFGNIFPMKYFNHMEFEGGDSRKYAKSIGIVFDDYRCMGCQIYENLIGCCINNVLYGDTTMIVGLQNISSEIPKQFSLYQNYPNPFNPGTKIKFDIKAEGKSEKALQKNGGQANVKLIIYDALGREITTRVNEQLNPGTYEVEWDAGNSPSGVYFYKLEAKNFIQTKKMVLIK
jgi:hypothetical protein